MIQRIHDAAAAWGNQILKKGQDLPKVVQVSRLVKLVPDRVILIQ